MTPRPDETTIDSPTSATLPRYGPNVPTTRRTVADRPDDDPRRSERRARSRACPCVEDTRGVGLRSSPSTASRRATRRSRELWFLHRDRIARILEVRVGPGTTEHGVVATAIHGGEAGVVTTAAVHDIRAGRAAVQVRSPDRPPYHDPSLSHRRRRRSRSCPASRHLRGRRSSCRALALPGGGRRPSLAEEVGAAPTSEDVVPTEAPELVGTTDATEHVGPGVPFMMSFPAVPIWVHTGAPVEGIPETTIDTVASTRTATSRALRIVPPLPLDPSGATVADARLITPPRRGRPPRRQGLGPVARSRKGV